MQREWGGPDGALVTKNVLQEFLLERRCWCGLRLRVWVLRSLSENRNTKYCPCEDNYERRKPAKIHHELPGNWPGWLSCSRGGWTENTTSVRFGQEIRCSSPTVKEGSVAK